MCIFAQKSFSIWCVYTFLRIFPFDACLQMCVCSLAITWSMNLPKQLWFLCLGLGETFCLYSRLDMTRNNTIHKNILWKFPHILHMFFQNCVNCMIWNHCRKSNFSPYFSLSFGVTSSYIQVTVLYSSICFLLCPFFTVFSILSWCLRNLIKEDRN